MNQRSMASVLSFLYKETPPKELSGNKSYKFIGTVFCQTKPESARIPGYVSAFRLKDGGKQADKCMIY
ncbi:MAG: hypothetical protein LBJ60_07175, partial [Tannerellaceae bacterium]|nr:hypothetical protein [Tannerellaceae bacterium]